MVNNIWDKHEEVIRHRIDKGDSLDEFLRWPTIEGTMFVGHAPFVHGEYLELDERLISASMYSPIGGREPSALYNGACTNMIHQAYHLSIWERETGKLANNLNVIVELGGGYGAMCRLVHNLGFDGDYHMYDLPYVCYLQNYYLRAHGLSAAFHPVIDFGFSTPPNDASLLIACFSMSETPYYFRDAFFDRLMPESVLIAYTLKHGDYDNIKFFADFQQTRGDYLWRGFINPHYDYGNIHYLIGERKEL